MRTLLGLLCCLAGLARLSAATWQEVTWNGEAAFAADSQGWRAVVSVVRSRLMYFGPADREINLLLAPATRENRNRLGGHRLWLGPQAEWPHGWPPPAAWEYRAPAATTTEAGVLRLVMDATGDDWPRLTRTYRWTGASLVCGAEFSGGTRPAQFVQILQVPADTVVTLRARPEESYPAGCVLLPSTAGPFADRFALPPHATRRDDALTLRHTGTVVKLGFRPQTLTAHLGAYELLVGRGTQSGQTAGEPDRGFHTQVYFSDAHESFAELEQLSPLFAAGQDARFEIVLTGRAR